MYAILVFLYLESFFLLQASFFQALSRTSVCKKLKVGTLAKFYDRRLRRVIGKTADNAWKVQFQACYFDILKKIILFLYLFFILRGLA